MSRKKVYLAIDAHASHCVLGVMDCRGNFGGSYRFVTSETELISHVEEIDAGKKILTVEESEIAYWISRTLRPYVTEIIIADPREIPLVSRNACKNDRNDVRNLCRLLRLGELRRVYHPEDDSRAVFKTTVQQYIDLRNQVKKLKQKIKGKYRYWGIPIAGKSVYNQQKKHMYLKQISSTAVRNQLKRLYCLLDVSTKMKESVLKEAEHFGKKFPEISEFMKIPGIGIVGALIFDAYIQTPHRFRKKSQLYRYSKLSIVKRSSDEKQIGRVKLDRAGNGELKAMSNRAFTCAMGTRHDNEVKRYYNASLSQTGNSTHARLNTQRKILSVLHGVWRKREEYRPELFTRM